jgi:hypothetical protein
MMLKVASSWSSSSLLVLQLLLVASLCVGAISGQEQPIPNLANFQEGFNFRTNVCDRQASLYDEHIRLPDALRGLNLSVAITPYFNEPDNAFFTLDEENRILESDPGLFVVILDEVAKRAGFEWRNNFGAFQPLQSGSNKTWSDILKWQVEHFDISMEYWARSLERLGDQISFPEGWWDATIVIVEHYDHKLEEVATFNLLNFLSPFTYSVWGYIFLAMVLSGLTYWALEKLNTGEEGRGGEANGLNLSDKYDICGPQHLTAQYGTCPDHILQLELLVDFGYIGLYSELCKLSGRIATRVLPCLILS